MARGGGEVGLLEELAANAVAASGVQLVDGWLLRVWPEAPFRRSNAVLPIRCDPGSLDERLVLVEEFYRRHGLPVRYQISPAVEPTTNRTTTPVTRPDSCSACSTAEVISTVWPSPRVWVLIFLETTI